MTLIFNLANYFYVFFLDVNITTAWQSRRISRTISVKHELPERPEIEVYLSDFELPTCISSQLELDRTKHKRTVKV